MLFVVLYWLVLSQTYFVNIYGIICNKTIKVFQLYTVQNVPALGRRTPSILTYITVCVSHQILLLKQVPKYFMFLPMKVIPRVKFIINIIPKIIPSLLRAYLEYYQSHRTHFSITLSIQFKLKAEWL